MRLKVLQNTTLSIYAYVSTAASNSLMENRDISKNKKPQSSVEESIPTAAVSSYILCVKGIFLQVWLNDLSLLED